jgi:ribosomal protein S18 acetylase RimI-like enzyme
MHNECIIRSATSAADLETAYDLIYALAVHENSLDSFKITKADFIKRAFNEDNCIHVLIAEADGNIVGVTTYVKRFHIWNGSDLIELDDLYVAEHTRGLGIGSKLLRTVGKKAKVLNIPVKWQVDTSNTGAIKLYKKLGANYNETGICFWLPDNIENGI